MEPEFETSDQTLVERIRRGDQRAFEDLISRYRSRILRLAHRFTGGREDSEEVMQEVSLTLYQKMDQFESKSTFATWLYRIVVNTALMKIRSRGQAEHIPLEDIAEERAVEEEGPRPEERIFTEESLAKIEQVVVHLPDEFKTVVILRDIEGFSNEETAEIMGLTVAAVKSRLHRARGFLRGKLEDLYREAVKS